MVRIAIAVVMTASAAVPLAASAQKPPKTTPPSALSLKASPTLVTFGRSTVLDGRLRGSDNSGRTIAIDHNPFPFPALVPLATATTDRNGDYRFVTRPDTHTRYRARTVPRNAAEAAINSPEVLVRVALRVSFRLSDRTPRRGARVRFYGFAAPKHDGHLVYIQRRRRDGKWATVARTRTREAVGDKSSFSRRVRIMRDGVFRIRVRGHADHATGTSRRRSIRVH